MQAAGLPRNARATSQKYRRRSSCRNPTIGQRKLPRSKEYDHVAHCPRAPVEGRAVLEIAAGTGYWTDVIADCASEIAATDINMATLQVAMARRTWPDSVAFVAADAFALEDVAGTFDAAFSGFFWSHVPLALIDDFLRGVFRRMSPGALMVALDNRYVEGSSHQITRKDEDGNTYQTRSLENGATY